METALGGLKKKKMERTSQWEQIPVKAETDSFSY